jgi:hypothetical protein
VRYQEEERERESKGNEIAKDGGGDMTGMYKYTLGTMCFPRFSAVSRLYRDSLARASPPPPKSLFRFLIFSLGHCATPSTSALHISP